MANCNNYCKNGKCSNCGNCCTELIPLTKTEVRLIKAYIKEKNIKPFSDILFSTNGQYSVNLMCPFRNFDTNRCMIYEVRPKICRKFKCDQSNETIEKNKQLCHLRATYNMLENKNSELTNLYSTRELIYGDKSDTVMLLLGNVMKDISDENISKVKKSDLFNFIKTTMKAFKREDIDDELIYNVIQEYSKWGGKNDKV